MQCWVRILENQVKADDMIVLVHETGEEAMAAVTFQHCGFLSPQPRGRVGSPAFQADSGALHSFSWTQEPLPTIFSIFLFHSSSPNYPGLVMLVFMVI